MIIAPYTFQLNGGDPYWSNVTSLIHFDGADGSTTITDVKSNTWSVSGLAALESTDPIFGTASLYVPNDGFVYCDIATYSTSPFYLGDTFTIDFYINATSLPASEYALVSVAEPTGTNFAATTVTINSVGGITITCRPTSGGSVTTISTASGVITAGVDQSIAISCNAGTCKIFIDGVEEASGSLPTMTDGDVYKISIGGLANGTTPTYSFYGKIDEFRFTKGAARYSSGFTPAAPFPNY